MDTSSWLLFTYQLPAGPSTHRAFVWRKLKSLGALYLQNSICILPVEPSIDGKLAELRSEIAGRGGEARILHISLNVQSESDDIIALFGDQMSDDYGEFLEQCSDFHAELEKERTRKHFTFGELEENEAELGKLKLWLQKLIGRDYFEVALRREAIAALQSCERDYEVFQRETESGFSGIQ